MRVARIQWINIAYKPPPQEELLWFSRPQCGETCVQAGHRGHDDVLYGVGGIAFHWTPTHWAYRRYDDHCVHHKNYPEPVKVVVSVPIEQRLEELEEWRCKMEERWP